MTTIRLPSFAVLSATIMIATLMPLAGSGCRYVDVGAPSGYVDVSLNTPITFVVSSDGTIHIKGEVEQVIGPFKVQAGFAMPIVVNPDGKRLVIAFRDRAAEALGIDNYYGVDRRLADLIAILDNSRAFVPNKPLIIDITDHRPREVVLMPRSDVPPSLTLEAVPDDPIDGGPLLLPTEAPSTPVPPTVVAEPEASPWPCGNAFTYAAFAGLGENETAQIPAGGCENIYWGSCQAIRIDLSGQTIADGPEAATGGQLEVCPETSTTFVLEFIGSDGLVMEQRTLTLQVAEAPTEEPTAIPPIEETATPVRIIPTATLAPTVMRNDGTATLPPTMTAPP